jgi:hypothetical protein
MAIMLTAEEMGYLERLAEAGGRGINAPILPVSLHGVLYVISRNALADAHR